MVVKTLVVNVNAARQLNKEIRHILDEPPQLPVCHNYTQQHHKQVLQLAPINQEVLRTLRT